MYFLHIRTVHLGVIKVFYHCIYGFMFSTIFFNFVSYVFFFTLVPCILVLSTFFYHCVYGFMFSTLLFNPVSYVFFSHSYRASWYYQSFFYHCVYGFMFSTLLFNSVSYVFFFHIRTVHLGVIKVFLFTN